MTGNRLRREFINFFEKQDHKVLPGISLVPTDPSLLLTAAGVVPFRGIIEGVEEAPAPRVTTCQRCVRTADLENVGDESHLTFFEMLGNFSFGDYYKKESLLWGWEFLTGVIGLPKDCFWATLYREDDEAFSIWRDEIGHPADRITRLERDEIFWGPVGDTGACGPCSEIHWDWGEEFGCGPGCNPGCSCGSGRFLEVWNHVFTELRKNEDGSYSALPSKNIDTGMGLERLACVVRGTRNVYETDLLGGILEAVTGLTGDQPDSLHRRRVITEHARSSTFMVMDNITPGNEGREYVLRRLIRRAARTGKQLGLNEPFLHRLVEPVVRTMEPGYPELVERREYITQVIQREEEAFFRTLEQGLFRLNQVIDTVSAEGRNVVEGSDAFFLYDTLGFPIDLTREIAEERGLKVDLDGFAEAMKAQRKRSQDASVTEDLLGGAGTRGLSATEFVGYDRLRAEARVIAVLDGGREVILDRSPFYAESGGQTGDTGRIEKPNGGRAFRVRDTRKSGDVTVHFMEEPAGELQVGDAVVAEVDAERRAAIRRAHTATHLLQAALREVLGRHVAQAGSWVGPDALRFDFSHFQALAPDEIERIEDLVNRKVLQDLPVEFRLLLYTQAIEEGAMALFGEKYGAEVRTQRIGDFSLELCGGTHVERTGRIGLVRLVSESSVGAGMRRIEAVTGFESLRALRGATATIHAVSGALSVVPEEIIPRLERQMASLRRMERQIAEMERRMAVSSLDALLARKMEIGGVATLVSEVSGVDAEGIKSLIDAAADRLGPSVVVLAGETEGRVSVAGKVTGDLTDRGLHAGQLVREVARVTGGGGGGKPDFAQGAGKDPSKLGVALERVNELILESLGL